MYQTLDEMGTIEYGVYASREEATKRAYEVWDEKGWPKDEIQEFPDGSLFHVGLTPECPHNLEIEVQEYELGEGIEKWITKYE